jgi:hypothetical protein
MYRTHECIVADVGAPRLERAGELGVLRLMLRYDSHFYSLLELEEVLAVVDANLSSTAILHLQNGLILPPCGEPRPGERFQTTYTQAVTSLDEFYRPADERLYRGGRG